MEDPAFLNGLQKCVTRWSRAIQKVTQMERDASSGTTLQVCAYLCVCVCVCVCVCARARACACVCVCVIRLEARVAPRSPAFRKSHSGTRSSAR
jgi:hypothetical protein